MATVLDTITDAYRVAGILPLDEDPESEEATFALSGLQSMFQSWVANGMFGLLTDVYKTAAYTAKEGERVTHPGSVTITLPDTYEDGGDEYGDGTGSRRAAKELSVIQVVDSNTDATTTYIYDRSQWVEIETLATTDTCPLSGYGQRGLAACLAIELCALPAFGAQVTPGLLRSANAFKAAVRSRRYETLGSDAQTPFY